MRKSKTNGDRERHARFCRRKAITLVYSCGKRRHSPMSKTNTEKAYPRISWRNMDEETMYGRSQLEDGDWEQRNKLKS